MLELRKPHERYLLGAALLLSLLLMYIAIQTQMADSITDLSRPDGRIDVPYGDLKSPISNATIHASSGCRTGRRLPQAIIIGTRKSGTRALAKFLEINPAIRSAHREVHFFDRLQNYRLGLGWYREQMPCTSEHQLTIEKSPAYFVTSEVPERIKAMNASIKLIVIMRDPVTRLVSDFSQLLANRVKSSLVDYDKEDYELGNMDESSPEGAIVENKTLVSRAAERELEGHLLRPDGGIDEQRRIVQAGMYAVHLERWTSVFPREQFHFVDGERLIKEPHAELQGLELFLGFERPAIMKEHFVFSPKKGFYCMASLQLMGDESRDNATVRVDNKTIHKHICLGKSKGRRHISIGKELSEKLKDFYAPYNEYLLSLTGLNFTY